MAFRARPRKRTLTWVGLSAVAAAFAALAGASCLTVAPPSLPTPGPVRPTILHDAVVPTAGVPLLEWPEGGGFIVPVEIDGPDEPFFYDVFIDYDPVTGSGNVVPPQIVPATPNSFDGGIVSVPFTIATPPDPRFCHTIEFLVAYSFNRNSLHTPDSLGGDIVTWFYMPDGGRNGCPEYDAGAFQNGAFPLDGSADVLPVAAQSPL